MCMKSIIIILFLSFTGCFSDRDVEALLFPKNEDGRAINIEKMNCPLHEGECQDYFKRLVDSSQLLMERTTSFVKKRKQFREDHTYNRDRLNEMLEEEKTFLECTEVTPLGNKREFFARWNSSSDRKVYETNKYFQNKLADHYYYLADCYKEAEIKLQRLIDKYKYK